VQDEPVPIYSAFNLSPLERSEKVFLPLQGEADHSNFNDPRRI